MKLSGYGSCKQAEAQEGFQGSHFSIKVFMLRYAILKKHLGCIDKDPAVGRSWGVLCSLRSGVQFPKQLTSAANWCGWCKGVMWADVLGLSGFDRVEVSW